MEKGITSKILTGLMVLLGVASLIYGVILLFKDTSGYVSTQAVVTDSIYGTSDDSGNESYNVYYTYTVDGTSYSGSFTGTENDKAGDTLTVWYDPEKPGTSYQSQGEANCLGGIGVLFGLFCLGGYAWSWMKKRRASRVTEAAPSQEPPVPPAA